MTWLLIAVILILAAVLIVVEICTPTFGTLMAVAIGLVAWAVYLCYTINPVLGIIAAGAAVIILPVYIYFAAKKIPNTALGRVLALHRDKAEPGQGVPEADTLEHLVGRVTTAESVLRPSGIIHIDDKRIVAQAEGGMIEKGTKVKIIRASGTDVIVRKITEESS